MDVKKKSKNDPGTSSSKEQKQQNQQQESSALKSILLRPQFKTYCQSTRTNHKHKHKHKEQSSNDCINGDDVNGDVNGEHTDDVNVVEDFFEKTWQRHPCLFLKSSNDDSHGNVVNDDIILYKAPKEVQDNKHYSPALEAALNMTWDDIANMMEHSRKSYTCTHNDDTAGTGAHSNTDTTENYTIANANANVNPSNIPPPPELQPLIFRNQTPLQPHQIQTDYSSNPFASYIDGCSIVQNHADCFSTIFKNLCRDLQQSFPHVYINTYLTPTNSSAVKAHADDRDVFVIQIQGCKRWKVYKDVPVPYPYAHEQVGKNGVPVPFLSSCTSTDSKNNGHSSGNTDTKSTTQKSSSSSSSSSSSTLIETTLHPGDILYMPRGYVHEACTMISASDLLSSSTASSTTTTTSSSQPQPQPQPSFHATVAIMTSDWSISKTISEMTRTCLDSIPEYKMAIDCNIGRNHKRLKSNHHHHLPNRDTITTRPTASNMTCTSRHTNMNISSNFHQTIESAFEQMKKYITVEKISNVMYTKYKVHNDRSKSMIWVDDDDDNNNNDNKNSYGENGSSQNIITGPKAARYLTMQSKIRSSTTQERASVTAASSSSSRATGLTVREDISDIFLSMVTHIKSVPNHVFIVSELHNLIRVLSSTHHDDDDDDDDDDKEENNTKSFSNGVCDFTLLCFVKCCVALGVMAIVQ